MQASGQNKSTPSRDPSVAVKPGLSRDRDGKIHREAVEYNVVDHCNLSCAGCDHFAPHLARRFSDVGSFAADMKALAPHLHVRILRLVGGEPLLHPELPSFIQAARDSGIADEVWLWTNGLLLHAVDIGLLESVDVVRVSLYPGVRIRADLNRLAEQLEQNGRSRMQVVRVEKFFHQLLNVPRADASEVRRTYLQCRETHVWSCHTVQQGRYYKCTKPSTLAQRLAAHGVQASDAGRDGVLLHDNPRLGEELEQYLLSREPLLACASCLGTDGKSFRHHQLNAAELHEERRAGVSGRAMVAHPVKRFLRGLRDDLRRSRQ